MGGRHQARIPDAVGWFDLWHTHIDWHREARDDPVARRDSLLPLFDAWDRIEALGATLSVPWQSWVVIDANDSGQNAVYLHTPNPNRDNFPYSFDDVVWGDAPPEWLAEFVVGKGCEVGLSESDSNLVYWILRSIPLEPLNASRG